MATHPSKHPALRFPMWNGAVASIAAASVRQHDIALEFDEATAQTRLTIESSRDLLRVAAKAFPDDKARRDR